MLQRSLADAHGSQCGFCTPGFVMSMYALTQTKPQPTVPDIEEALAGNLCRCTGYRPILDAFASFARSGTGAECSQGCADVGSACPSPPEENGHVSCTHENSGRANGQAQACQKSSCTSAPKGSVGALHMKGVPIAID